jgi:WD40 repeat protein
MSRIQFKVLIFAIAIVMGYVLLYGKLLKVYKKGMIELNPEQEFGMDTDWLDPVFYKLSSIVVSKDGSIFASISNQHKICKFDLNGKFLKTFSRKGQGPGDTYYPSKLSILDGKYLVVSEYSTNRRISIFDLKGKFYRLVRTNYSVNDVVGLNDGKIAIISISYFNGHEKISVYIKDIFTGVEKCVTTSIEKMRKIKTEKLIIRSPFQRRCFICKTANGKLLVGFNDSNIISFYSHQGDKIDSFELNIKPIPVTGPIASKIKEGYIRYVHAEKKINPAMKDAYRSFENLFGDNLPLYSYILTDEEGNILVFYYNGYDRTNKPAFQVYSPNGDYICNCVLNFRNLNYELMDFKFKKRIAIKIGGFFGIMSFSDGDDSYLKIIKVNLNQ